MWVKNLFSHQLTAYFHSGCQPKDCFYISPLFILRSAHSFFSHQPKDQPKVYIYIKTLFIFILSFDQFQILQISTKKLETGLEQKGIHNFVAKYSGKICHFVSRGICLISEIEEKRWIQTIHWNANHWKLQKINSKFILFLGLVL